MEVAEANSGDCPQFHPLLEATTADFSLRRVFGYKAYLSYDPPIPGETARSIVKRGPVAGMGLPTPPQTRAVDSHADSQRRNTTQLAMDAATRRSRDFQRHITPRYMADNDKADS